MPRTITTAAGGWWKVDQRCVILSILLHDLLVLKARVMQMTEETSMVSRVSSGKPSDAGDNAPPFGFLDTAPANHNNHGHSNITGTRRRTRNHTSLLRLNSARAREEKSAWSELRRS